MQPSGAVQPESLQQNQISRGTSRERAFFFFKKNVPVFRPTCAKELAQEHLATFDPNKSEIPEISTNGMPPDADD
jgi:hypothetical protein